MTTPACVTKGGEFVTLGWRRRSGIGVRFLVMMMREVVESLQSIAAVGVVGDTIICCAEEIFDGMDGSFVMLMVR